jgi:galactose mutarotase-like enzyme
MQFLQLHHGRTRVSIAPAAGGRIAQIAIFDGAAWQPLLHDDAATPPHERDPLAWGSYVMAPWPNRVAAGRFPFDGGMYDLPRNADGHALHGLVFDRAWTVQRHGERSALLAIEIGSPWPWPARCTQRFELHDDGVSQTVELHALGDAFPAGIGWHPWFRREAGPGSDVRLRVDAGRRYEAVALIPTGRLLPVDGPFDLRGGPPLGDRRLDDCYAGVAGSLVLDRGSVTLTVTSTPNVGHAVIYTPPGAVCVEPQTCAVDAFNLAARGIDAGAVVVAPGRPLVASTSWRWQIAGS